MSPQNQLDDITDEELTVTLTPTEDKKTEYKRKKRQQGIIHLVKSDPHIRVEDIADKLGVTVRTIRRDLNEMKTVVEFVGPSKGGEWKLLRK